MDQKNQEIKEILRTSKIMLSEKLIHHSIKHIYKDHKILKFADILKVQNCLFMYHFEQNNALATSFPVLHSKGKHNY